MKKIFLLNFVIFLILAACGKKKEVDDDVQYEEPPNGTYTALLFPVNEKLSADVSGKVRVTKLGDQFEVSVRVSKSNGGIHPQHLQSGVECPLKNADANHDGYITFQEARKSIGHKLVPFDDDLSSQMGGNNSFPSGNYRYRKSTSYALMLSDLKQPSETNNDSMIKLESNELPLDGRVVVIYGSPKKVPSGLSGNEFPIACGVLNRTSDFPEDDEWDDPNDSERRPPPPRPPRRPPPEPEPPKPPPRPPEPDSWWERMWERWNNWRERWRDWWD